MLQLIVTTAAESAQLGGGTLAIVHDHFDGYGLRGGGTGASLFLSGHRTLEELSVAYAARHRSQPLLLERMIERLLRERPELTAGGEDRP